MTRAGTTRLLGGFVLAVLMLLAGAVAAAPARAETLAPGFVDSPVFSGLQNPTAVRFAPAPDTRVFVAQKNGLLYAYPSVSSSTPVLVADLRTEVDDYWDRGLLGLAVDPRFPAQPYVYVLYTYDAPINGTAPVWNDACPSPPGPLTDGCVVSGRLARIQIDPATNTMVAGSEKPLINDWCQQYPSHSIGDLAFGPQGELLASGGTGASWTFADYGQGGGSAGDQVTPSNPCGDPPVPVGGTQVAPTAEGGSLRSQSFRRSDGPATLDGALIRVDPSTGVALADNAASASSDPNRQRIVAFGLRQPFRFTIRPGTDEVWVGDVGENDWEEIDRLPHVTGPIANFGWPCYEGAGAMAAYQAAGLNLCTSLYASGSAVAPYYTYNHASSVVTNDGCAPGGSSISGLAFENGGPYPASYQGALFFADHTRNCIWAMLAGAGGLPDPSRIVPVATSAGNPVDVQRGPDGAIYYADLDGGQIHRLGYMTPQAAASAAPANGDAPLRVTFTGDGSSDPDPNATLIYRWDFGDGQSAAGADTVHTYTHPGTYAAVLTVSDQQGASDSRRLTITAGATPATASIDAPASSLTWAVGDRIDFAGSASDAVGSSPPPSAFVWSLIIHHCPIIASSCHTHHIQDFTGVTSGSFAAPDHGYPSYLELDLTVTNSSGLTDTRSVMLHPRPVNISVASDPPGAVIGFDDEAPVAPFQRTVIAGSINSLAAPLTLDTGHVIETFQTWSDGGAADHNVVASPTDETLTAIYAAPSPLAVAPTPLAPPAPVFGGPLPNNSSLLGQPTTAAAPAPVLSGCSLSPRRFSAPAPSAGSRHAVTPHGPTLRCTLSASAHVHLTIASIGAVVRSARGRSSLSPLQIGLAGRAGPNAFDVGRALALRPLKPGAYRVTILARAGGRTSRPAYAEFVVVVAAPRQRR